MNYEENKKFLKKYGDVKKNIPFTNPNITFKSNKKILIVGGDSWSDKTFRSSCYPDMDVSWPKWPELLAKKWNMEIINLSRGGQGNEFIYSAIQDTIMNIEDKSKIGMVIGSWSQVSRYDYQITEGHAEWAHTNARYSWWSERVQPAGDLMGWLRKSIRNFLGLQIMCERYDIPYMQFCMVHPYRNFLNGLKPTEGEVFLEGLDWEKDAMKYPGNKQKDEKNILRILSEHEHLIDIEKFIGWPMASELGGFILNNAILGKAKKDKLPWIIDKLDEHPNAKGQVKLMEWIKTKAENIYDGLG